MNEVINNIKAHSAAQLEATKEEVKEVEQKTKIKLHELKEKLDRSFKHKRNGETPKTEAAPPTPGSSVM